MIQHTNFETTIALTELLGTINFEKYDVLFRHNTYIADNNYTELTIRASATDLYVLIGALNKADIQVLNKVRLITSDEHASLLFLGITIPSDATEQDKPFEELRTALEAINIVSDWLPGYSSSPQVAAQNILDLLKDLEGAADARNTWDLLVNYVNDFEYDSTITNNEELAKLYAYNELDGDTCDYLDAFVDWESLGDYVMEYEDYYKGVWVNRGYVFTRR